MTPLTAADDECDVTDPQGYAPTANPFGQRGHRIPPTKRSYAADEAERRRTGTPPPIGKDMQRALDKAQRPTKGQTENARVVVQQSILQMRKVPQIHWKAVKKFVADTVTDDTDLAEYKQLVNGFLDTILGKPDYGQDPHKWETYIRGCIANRCKEADPAITNPTNIDQIRDDVFATARADGKMGDEAYMLELAAEEIRAFNEVRAEAAKPVIDTGAWRFESDAFRKLVLDAQAGDYFIRQIIGAEPKAWPEVRAECLRQIREASSAAAKDGDGQPIAASVKQDWSAAAKAVQDMQAVAKEHTMDPDQMLFAVPNHLKRELGVDDKIVGKHVFTALGMALNDHIARFGPAKTWTEIESHVADEKAAAKVQAAKPQPPSVDSEDLREVFGRDKVTDTKPEALKVEPASTRNSNAEAPSNVSNGSKGSEGQPTEQKPVVEAISKTEPPVAPAKAKLTLIKPEPSPLLQEIKTLMGIPASELYRWLNRKHDQRYYKAIKAKDNKKDANGNPIMWTDLDPVAVRKRFDKVFGPQGLGWRILPLENGRSDWQPSIQKTSKGEREVALATSTLFVFEYTLVVGGQMQWFRTSAFSDYSLNDDPGDALRGVSTSLMKQALRLFGGFDHFVDKAPDDTAA